MTPAKETKHITYTLLQENYIQLQEVRKPGVSAAPMKTFFLFHIDLDQVVRMEIEHCYHALHNTIQRREYEITTNKRMIDKHLKIQTLTATFKEKGATQEQLEEVGIYFFKFYFPNFYFLKIFIHMKLTILNFIARKLHLLYFHDIEIYNVEFPFR